MRWMVQFIIDCTLHDKLAPGYWDGTVIKRKGAGGINNVSAINPEFGSYIQVVN